VISIIEVLRDEGTAGAVAGVLGVISAALAMDGPRWDRKFSARLEEHKTLEKLTKSHYSRRPGPDIYGFVQDLALGVAVRRRNERLLARSRKAAGLAADKRAKGRQLAVAWIESVGSFARLASEVEMLALRRFLQTYHLSIIREGSLVLPFVVDLLACDLLSDEEADDAMWGWALVELAAFYNSVARQQRQPVYFLAIHHERPVGPVVQAPGTWRRAVYGVVDRLSPRMKLRRWRMLSARYRLSYLSNQLKTDLKDMQATNVRKLGDARGEGSPLQ
jgi:hypothetical protein